MLYYLMILKEKCDCFKDKEKEKQKEKEMLNMINDIIQTQTELIDYIKTQK